MFDLTGRVAAVTGASAGLGRQFALALAKQGADIAIMARRKNKLEEVAQEIRTTGVKCLVVPCDVTKLDQVKDSVATIINKFGKVDILVNNAGGGGSAPLEEMTNEIWQHNIDLELTGTFQCTREFGREMLKRGYGRIINIASIFGLVGNADVPVAGYHASKGGVVNFTRAAAAEWATRGVTVNALCPGFFPSEANNPEAMAAMDSFIRRCTPMKRPGKEGELDSAIIFLAADESTYVTGSVVTCDGGWTCI
ncbi:SDR family NAD(P)-dependent oxidoreductase [Tepidanaerobacter syntrophicus]|uniref:Gluconate 5-dehydrogenase n=1 Tax=Tepidanaerobacter syntrophicus TaxID=224999 RepID=A0A0U9HG72_9FIRM|nr:SDR family NAD(P)-dependent oxidoreductase [Tepidanaerobacter syntrophicus]GAQ25526.1 gluconate 5-dehydrogenase [Tepidanaerobacter syntrophicus]HHV82488.1 SDR family oxidoreductase [Tepidanaerobacter syntrophicus]